MKKRPIIIDGRTALRELSGLDLRGAHLHFNATVDLKDLAALNLQQTVLIINPQQSNAYGTTIYFSGCYH
jgi:hypothetical protein